MPSRNRFTRTDARFVKEMKATIFNKKEFKFFLSHSKEETQEIEKIKNVVPMIVELFI